MLHDEEEEDELEYIDELDKTFLKTSDELLSPNPDAEAGKETTSKETHTVTQPRLVFIADEETVCKEVNLSKSVSTSQIQIAKTISPTATGLPKRGCSIQQGGHGRSRSSSRSAARGSSRGRGSVRGCGVGRGGRKGKTVETNKKKNVGDWKDIENDTLFKNPNREAPYHEFV